MPNYECSYARTNELYHFGIPGMKWGVRKKYEKLYTIRKSDRRKNSVTDYSKVTSKTEKARNKYEKSVVAWKTDKKNEQLKSEMEKAKSDYKKSVKDAKAEGEVAIAQENARNKKIAVAAIAGTAAVAAGVIAVRRYLGNKRSTQNAVDNALNAYKKQLADEQAAKNAAKAAKASITRAENKKNKKKLVESGFNAVVNILNPKGKTVGTAAGKIHTP